MRFLIAIVTLLLLVTPFAGGAQLANFFDGTGNCLPGPSRICFHLYDSTTSAAAWDKVAGSGVGVGAGDSAFYEVRSCTDGIQYTTSMTGGCEFQIYECMTNTDGRDSASCSEFVGDMNNSGFLETADEALTYTGTAPRSGIDKKPRAPFHWIDATVSPTSGTCVVGIFCR